MGQTVTVGGQTRTIKGTSNKASKGAPASKRPGANNSPSRQRYWASGKLRERKIKRLMKACHLTRAEATIQWEDQRQGRRMKRA